MTYVDICLLRRWLVEADLADCTNLGFTHNDLISMMDAFLDGRIYINTPLVRVGFNRQNRSVLDFKYSQPE